jgi:hypothetical protein
MPKKRTIETEEERLNRLTKVAHELRVAGAQEDDALDTMVRRSIELHGP